MPAPYLTNEGLQIPTVEEIIDTVAQEQRDAIDPLLDTDPDSPIGQINGIFGSHLREAWEVLSIVFNATDPDAAEGALLEAIAAITGTFRAPATRSVFVGTRKLRATLQANKTIPEGIIIEQAGNPSVRFRTIEPITSTAAGDYFVAA